MEAQSFSDTLRPDGVFRDGYSFPPFLRTPVPLCFQDEMGEGHYPQHDQNSPPCDDARRIYLFRQFYPPPPRPLFSLSECIPICGLPQSSAQVPLHGSFFLLQSVARTDLIFFFSERMGRSPLPHLLAIAFPFLPPERSFIIPSPAKSSVRSFHISVKA